MRYRGEDEVKDFEVFGHPIVDMFKNTPQAKYLNRHTVKISYSTMRNLKSHIAASNIKKLRPKQQINWEKECNCENQKRVCPVNAQCTTGFCPN